MNSDFPKDSRAELELKLTALLLGELPADEAFTLGRAIEQDAELKKMYERLGQTVALVREIKIGEDHPTSQEPFKLSEGRREKLAKQFKTISPKEFSRSGPKFQIHELVAVLAIVAILAAMMLPALSKAKNKSRNFSKGASTHYGYEMAEASKNTPAPA